MIKDSLDYKLTVEGEEGLIIKFNSETPEKIIGDRSLYGIEDTQLISQIIKKPFMTVRNLHILVERNDEIYEFVIPKGYCHDGATIPAIAWKIVGQKTEPRLKLASCVHDYLCEHHYVINGNRDLSTRVFITLCDKFGKIGKVKRTIMYYLINLFQKIFCNWGN